MNLSKEEQELATEFQTSINKAKQELRDAKKAMKAMMNVQEAAGRTKAHAAAYRVFVEADAALNAVFRAHSTATDAMAETYGDDGGIVVFGSGGR